MPFSVSSEEHKDKEYLLDLVSEALHQCTIAWHTVFIELADLLQAKH